MSYWKNTVIYVSVNQDLNQPLRYKLSSLYFQRFAFLKEIKTNLNDILNFRRSDILMIDTLQNKDTDVLQNHSNMFHKMFCSLSLKERQVATLSGTGKTIDNIAKDLHLSIQLVERTVKNLRAKLNHNPDEYRNFLTWVNTYINMV